MVRKFLIANLIFEINFEADAVMEEMLAPYSCDVTKSTDILININWTQNDIDIRRENITKLADGVYSYSDNGKTIVFYYDENIAKTYAKICFSKDYKNNEIMLCNLEPKYGIPTHRLMYNICGRVFSYSMVMHSAFEFHSSSVAYDGAGVAFSAVSGTGKSTHTSLWLNNFEGAYLINDDTPVISKAKDGSFVISGTPWAGSTGINTPVTLPLKAIVFIERAPTNSIERISSAEAIAPMFKALRTLLNDAMLASIISTLNELLAQIPAYRLKCNMDSEAAFVARDAIWECNYPL